MVSACPSSFTPAFTSSIPFSAVPPKRERFAMTPLGALQALGASCTRAEILTFTALELHADRETGFCNPGRETLAEITGLPENRITKATTSLEKKGFIRKEQPDPFHVHYFVLPPPEPKPVEPRARFRPPLKASPAPEPAAQPVPPAGPNPCRQRHQLVPPTAHLTEQGIDQKEKESAGLAAAPPEPAAATPNGAHSGNALRNAKTSPPDCVPDSWMETGRLLRPDLSEEQVKASAEIFLDHQRSKGAMLADWIPAWRNWIRRERGPKTARQRPQATQLARRYPKPDQPEQPPDEATTRAMAEGEQRRIDMMISCGIDPATGLKLIPPAAVTEAPATAPPEQEPAPPHNSPPLAGLHKPMQEPELTPEQEQRQRQIADLAAQGLTLADAKAARNPVRPPAAPIPARRYTPEQQRQFIRLAQQGLSPQQIRERMRLD